MDRVAEELRPLLTLLTQQGKLAFTYSTAVRMEAQYIAFYDSERWGDPAVIKASLDAIRDKIIGITSTIHLEALLEQLEAVIPDVDEHESSLASYAMDAGCAIHEALRYLLESQDEQAINVANFSRNTVDMFAQELHDLLPTILP